MMPSWCSVNSELIDTMLLSPLLRLLLHPPQQPVHHLHRSLNPNPNLNRRQRLPLQFVVLRSYFDYFLPKKYSPLHLHLRHLPRPPSPKWQPSAYKSLNQSLSHRLLHLPRLLPLRVPRRKARDYVRSFDMSTRYHTPVNFRPAGVLRMSDPGHRRERDGPG
jgi:hypothetical protein